MTIPRTPSSEHVTWSSLSSEIMFYRQGNQSREVCTAWSCEGSGQSVLRGRVHPVPPWAPPTRSQKPATLPHNPDNQVRLQILPNIPGRQHCPKLRTPGLPCRLNPAPWLVFVSMVLLAHSPAHPFTSRQGLLVHDNSRIPLSKSKIFTIWPLSEKRC